MTGDARVVLVGAGHAHALVLERWAERAPGHTRLTVVTDRTELLYSGMVPGLVAGEYRRAQLVIDAAELAARAGAELVTAEVERVDAQARSLHLRDGPTVEYDVASLDVGSVTAGEPDVPVVRVSAPDDLVSALQDLGRGGAGPDALADGPCRRPLVVVVGGGAAGVELAAAIRARLHDGRTGGIDVRLVEEESRLLPGYSRTVSDRTARALTARGVDVRVAHPFVAGADPAALVVWATGSAAPPLLERSGLPVDAAGFVLVDETLQVIDHPGIFAVGDCASLLGHDLPKAGVHAVRQAPILFENLVKVSRSRGTGDVAGRRRYEPQSDFLTLLNLGDGTALGTKWGLVVEGRWVRWLKDRIDRRFVKRFLD